VSFAKSISFIGLFRKLKKLIDYMPYFYRVQVLMGGGVHNLWIDPKRRPLPIAPAKKILFELKS